MSARRSFRNVLQEVAVCSIMCVIATESREGCGWMAGLKLHRGCREEEARLRRFDEYLLFQLVLLGSFVVYTGKGWRKP